MWRLPDGKLFQDDDGNYLSIKSFRGNFKNIIGIKQAAAHYGQPEGKEHFEPGVEQVSDETHQEQKEMMQVGEIHDKDYGAIMDEKRALAAEV